MNILTLKLNDDKLIEVIVDNDEENYYYFEEVTIVYRNKNNSYILSKDFLCDNIVSFKNVASKALSGDLQLSEKLKERGIGYEYEYMSYEISNVDTTIDDISSKYMVWSTSKQFNTMTFMYNLDKDIFMEITPICYWHEDDISKEEFMRIMIDYKPHDIILLNTASLKSFLKECEDIISRMKL